MTRKPVTQENHRSHCCSCPARPHRMRRQRRRNLRNRGGLPQEGQVHRPHRRFLLRRSRGHRSPPGPARPGEGTRHQRRGHQQARRRRPDRLHPLTSAKPDGYTIGATGSPSVVVSPLDPSRGAKYTRSSFQPLGRQVIDPAVIAVQPDSPYKTLKELLDAAKAKPKSITASTTGLQTGEHFALAQIQETTGAEFAPVHFSEGASQATTAFLGKHVDVLVANVSDVTDLIKQGKARVLGIMTAERSPSLPDVPTFKENGYDVEAGTARGYSAPAGLPDAVPRSSKLPSRRPSRTPTSSRR